MKVHLPSGNSTDQGTVADYSSVFKGLVYRWKISIQFAGAGICINSSRTRKGRFSDLMQQVKIIKRIKQSQLCRNQSRKIKVKWFYPFTVLPATFFYSQNQFETMSYILTAKKKINSPQRIYFALPTQFPYLTEITLQLFCNYHDSLMTATLMGRKRNKLLFLLLSEWVLWHLRDKLHNNAPLRCLELQGDFMV